MKKLALFSLVFSSILFSSCKDDKPEPVDEPKSAVIVETKLYSKGNPIEIGDTVLFSDGTIFNLKLFKLYLSNITLLDENNQEVLLKDVALLDVGNANTGQFQATVPEGKFTKIKLGFGVDSVQNNADPTSFPDEHPLSSYNQMYWTMLKYRFAILEGRSNASGTFDMTSDVLNAYHPGTDLVYQTRTFDFNSLPVSNTFKVVLKIDIYDIFYNTPAIDLETEASTHSEASDIHIAQKFMSNLAKSTTIEVETALSL